MKRMSGVGTGLALVLAMSVAGQSAMAIGNDETIQPSGGAMIVDAVVARPLLAAATLGGTAIFLVSLPFSALGGNVDTAADTLIKTPAEATFRRCLGCKVSRRADEM
ncbi:hypothetical protein RSO68_14145 [Halomonas saccharevitans]|uniref:Multidrug transporter n=1 Tax=Halomonas saccharevitans TaxID=416872 RepID=A0ABU3NJB9_9GAMM|nr:hypothetical protein [Halomonas saccharevitans]MDT8880613.1 hypothetical protein [Halomonas saccharevitans]